MNCVASAYDASGKLVGCSEQELNNIISVQLYTIFALGSGLYIYKAFTAENWVDIAVHIGWGCVSAFTYTKRAINKHVLPGLIFGFKILSAACEKVTILGDKGSDNDSTVSDDEYYNIWVIKDGVETQCYSSVFDFVRDIHDNFVQPHPQSQSQEVDGDVINVQLSEANEEPKEELNSKPEDKDVDNAPGHEGDNEKDCDHGNDEDEDCGSDAETESDDGDEYDISEVIKNIESHTMPFDFMLSQVPTMQTIVNMVNMNPQSNARVEGMHVMKYDGFPRDNNGVHFYDRKFVPVDYRMMEIVLQYEGNEYDLNLASPDNFYVAGNRVLDPAFLKWFMLKNHRVNMVNTREGSEGVKCNYTIKCLDHQAVLHTLLPHNYLYVSVTGVEVQDSGLI